jgi:hypothetical protein
MGSGKLILLSLLLLPLSLLADTASDYATRGAQKYVFGQEDAAKKEVAEGLAKFPHDPELQEMVKLFKEKPPNNKQQQQNKNQQNKDQQNQDQQNKDKQQNQQQSPNGQDQQNQNQQQPTPSPGTTPTPTPTPGESPGESPTPTPGEGSPTPTPTATPGEQPGESPTPSPGEGTPSPTPGNEGSPTATPGSSGDENGNNGQAPSPSPGGTPAKPLTGDVKGVGDQQPKGSPTPAAQVAEAEPEKEGEMSPKQARRLLESMKDEEQKVQLDERRAVDRVYKDW